MMPKVVKVYAALPEGTYGATVAAHHGGAAYLNRDWLRAEVEMLRKVHADHHDIALRDAFDEVLALIDQASEGGA